MLRRLAVFPGPFSLEAVEAVAGDETMAAAECGPLLAGLVRKSLVAFDPAAGRLTYRLLETIRAYAGDKLAAAGERALLRARHARHVGEVLERAARDWDATADAAWLDRYGWLLADLRAALRWSLGPDGDRTLGLAIVGRSRQLWQQLNLRAEGRRWAEAAAAALGPDTPDGLVAPVWLAVGYLTGERSFERSILALRQAAELFRQLNDRVECGTALSLLGQVLALSGDTAAAADALAEARLLLEPGAGRRRLGNCAMGFGMLHTAVGSWSGARREYELARTLFEAVGATRLAMAALYNLADAMWTQGALDAAIDAKREALDLARHEGNWDLVGFAFGGLAGMLTQRGYLEDALVMAREAVPLCREAEYIDWLFPHLALRAAKVGRSEDAARLWGYAERVGSSTVPQIHERRAVDALAALLRDAMAPARIEELMTAGRHLDEDQAAALALA
jgi:tetratricopeptide (TPR) repeat protein